MLSFAGSISISARSEKIAQKMLEILISRAMEKVYVVWVMWTKNVFTQLGWQAVFCCSYSTEHSVRWRWSVPLKPDDAAVANRLPITDCCRLRCATFPHSDLASPHIVVFGPIQSSKWTLESILSREKKAAAEKPSHNRRWFGLIS